MKKIILSLLVTVFALQGHAQNYTFTDNGSAVKFSIKNFGINVSGTFTGLKGKAVFSPANPAAASINASVDVATVNTGNGSRDSHLKKEEYFDAVKYPLISFASTKITAATKAGTFQLEGKVTIKGVTKTVSFTFTATPKGGGYLFEGEFKINRRDFKVGSKSLVMSDNLTVSLSVLAKKM